MLGQDKVGGECSYKRLRARILVCSIHQTFYRLSSFTCCLINGEALLFLLLGDMNFIVPGVARKVIECDEFRDGEFGQREFSLGVLIT